APREAGRLGRPARQAAARAGLAVHDQRADRRTKRRPGAARDQRRRTRRQGAWYLRRPEERRLDVGGLLDLLRLVRGRAEQPGPEDTGAGAGLDREGVGLGLAAEPADPLQPRLR